MTLTATIRPGSDGPPPPEWAWEEVYAVLVPRLLALAGRRYGVRAQDAEDCMQAVIMEISAAGSSTIRNRDAYLTAAFLRQCHSLRDRRESPLEAAGERPDDPSGRLTAAIHFREAIGSIPVHCRGAITSWAIEGQTVRAAADRAAWSKASAYRRFKRCLRRLLDAL